MTYRAAFEVSVVWRVTWFSEHRLDELCLRDRGRDLHDRLLRVDDASLRDRPHLPFEAHGPEVLDRPAVEADLLQVVELLFLEDERLEEPETVLQARRDQEAALLRHVPHVEAERGEPVHPTAQVARRHVELVEVRAEPAGHAT